MLAGGILYCVPLAFVSILHLCKHAGTVAIAHSQRRIKSADLRWLRTIYIVSETFQCIAQPDTVLHAYDSLHLTEYLYDPGMLSGSASLGRYIQAYIYLRD